VLTLDIRPKEGIYEFLEFKYNSVAVPHFWYRFGCLLMKKIAAKSVKWG